MGNNYNIQFNPSEPSSEDIARHMDFDALLARHQQQNTAADRPAARMRPLRSRYLSYVSAAAAAIALLVFFFTTLNRPKPAKLEAAYFAERPFVNPPVEQIEPAFASFQIEVNQGGVYEYKSGSRLVVPAAAFMDDRGRLVSGEVEIKYREYHDFVDLFISGIPMTYDSAGVRYTLESAGMIEIYAEQNGQRVQMAPGKNISVEMISFIQVPPYLAVPPTYNVYQLDVEGRHWAFHSLDQMEIVEEFTDLRTDDPLYELKKELQRNLLKAEQNFEQQRRQLSAQITLPEEPVRPLSPDSDLPTFDFDLSEDVSTTAGQDQIWYVSPRNKNFDPRSLRVEWEDYRLRQLSEFEYEVTFISGETEVSIIISPALTGEAYTAAMERYRIAYDDYQERLAERSDRLEKETMELEAELQRDKQQARATYRDRVAALIDGRPDLQESDRLVVQKVRNRFTANSLGIWNCARPIAPLPQQLSATFVDADGQPITGRPVYLVDQRRNTVHRYLAQEVTPIRFDGESENILWTMTDDGQLLVSDASDWKTLGADADEVTFVLRPSPILLTDGETLKSILRFGD